jgi:predicted Zn-dependent protease with MMP-like domain
MSGTSRHRRKHPPLKKEHLDRVDHAWDALEDGDPESAGLEAEELMLETEEHPEVRFLLGAALLESGDPVGALEQLRLCDGQVDDGVVHRYYLASALFENHLFDEAVPLFREVAAAEASEAPPAYGLAECLEFVGEYDEAERSYERAHEIDPEGFPLPIRMKVDGFREVVAEAVEHLPDELRTHLRHLPVVVEDLPTREVLAHESGDEPLTPTVLGLFYGPSLREQSVFDPVTVPPTIFVYQRNLERFCRTREELIEEIRLTLYHELGHYLGLSEEELEERGLE